MLPKAKVKVLPGPGEPTVQLYNQRTIIQSLMSGVPGMQESELSLEVSRGGQSTSFPTFPFHLTSRPTREGLGGPSLLRLLALTLVFPETPQAHSLVLMLFFHPRLTTKVIIVLVCFPLL